MSKSMKSFLFCLVGFAVFEITGILIEPVLLIAVVFMIGAFISISTYIFKKIVTKHTFLKVMICSILGIVLFIINNTIFNFLSDKFLLQTEFYSISKMIYIYGVILMVLTSVVSLIIYLFDIIMSLFMKFPTDRNINSIKVFKFSLWGVLTFSIAGLIFNMFTLLVLLFQLISIISGIVVISANISARVPTKMIMCSISGFISCLIMYFYFSMLVSYFNIYENINVIDIYNYSCSLFLLAIFISTFVLIVNDIFSKLVGISGSFVALIISIIGASTSYMLYNFGTFVPFLPSNALSVFGITFILFILGIAISIMSIAFKLIFKDTKTEEIEQISIDLDEDISKENTSNKDFDFHKYQ